MLGAFLATMVAISAINPQVADKQTDANLLLASHSVKEAGLIQYAARRDRDRNKDNRKSRKNRREEEDYQATVVPPDPTEDPPLVEEPFGDGDPNDLTCDTANTYDPFDFDNVLENFEQTSTLRLSGPEWDNTLVRNCRIHSTDGAGIFIKNVRNVVIHNCEVWNTGDNGIKTSSAGSTENVTIDGNYVHDIPTAGIHAPQRSAEGIDHPGLRVTNNILENIDEHPIYVQSQDFLIEGNIIQGWRRTNGISVRSSGIVRCNSVEGMQLDSSKAAIKYYSDHQAGISNTLVIERNEITTDYTGIHLAPFADRYDGQPPPDHLVKSFIIRWNNIEAAEPISIDRDYDDPAFTEQTYDNQGSFR